MLELPGQIMYVRERRSLVMAENPYKKALSARNELKEIELEPAIESEPEPIVKLEPNLEDPQPERQSLKSEPKTPVKKRGRPATGKRSDDEWIGRTFYVKRDTDFDIEELLVKLRRQGIEIDKSELMEMLLAACVKWHQGENLEIHLVEISPIQKYKNLKR